MKKRKISMLILMIAAVALFTACGKKEVHSYAESYNREAFKDYDDYIKLLKKSKVKAENTVYKLYACDVLEIVGEYALEEEDFSQEILDEIAALEFNAVIVTGENIRYFPVFTDKKFALYIDESVLCIEEAVFSQNENITSLHLIGNEMEINDDAFSQCKNLKSVKMEGTFTYVGENMFSDCINLKEADILASIEELDEECFLGCIRLEQVTLPETLQEIPYRMFYNCIALPSIDLPDSVTCLESDAFMYCCSLTEIVLPRSVDTLSGDVFLGCLMLEKVKLDATLTEYVEDEYFDEQIVVEYY